MYNYDKWDEMTFEEIFEELWDARIYRGYMGISKETIKRIAENIKKGWKPSNFKNYMKAVNENSIKKETDFSNMAYEKLRRIYNEK